MDAKRRHRISHAAWFICGALDELESLECDSEAAGNDALVTETATLRDANQQLADAFESLTSLLGVTPLELLADMFDQHDDKMRNVSSGVVPSMN